MILTVRLIKLHSLNFFVMTVILKHYRTFGKVSRVVQRCVFLFVVTISLTAVLLFGIVQIVTSSHNCIVISE